MVKKLSHIVPLFEDSKYFTTSGINYKNFYGWTILGYDPNYHEIHHYDKGEHWKVEESSDFYIDPEELEKILEIINNENIFGFKLISVEGEMTEDTSELTFNFEEDFNLGFIYNPAEQVFRFKIADKIINFHCDDCDPLDNALNVHDENFMNLLINEYYGAFEYQGLNPDSYFYRLYLGLEKLLKLSLPIIRDQISNSSSKLKYFDLVKRVGLTNITMSSKEKDLALKTQDIDKLNIW